jgi:hypothetical protein
VNRIVVALSELRDVNQRRKIKKISKNKKKLKRRCGMDRMKKSFELFNLMIKKGFELYPVSEKSFPKVNEIRELSASVPFYFVLFEEISFCDRSKIFKTVVLTEEILLGYLNKKPPIIVLPEYRTVLVALPFWIYLNEQFLTDCTYRRGILKNGESEKLVRYVEETKIPSETEDVRGKFINAVMKLFAPYNTVSILSSLDTIESSPTIIKIPDQLKKYFEEKFGNSR